MMNNLLGFGALQQKLKKPTAVKEKRREEEKKRLNLGKIKPTPRNNLHEYITILIDFILTSNLILELN